MRCRKDNLLKYEKQKRQSPDIKECRKDNLLKYEKQKRQSPDI